jgi:hypothetical protein
MEMSPVASARRLGRRQRVASKIYRRRGGPATTQAPHPSGVEPGGIEAETSATQERSGVPARTNRGSAPRGRRIAEDRCCFEAGAAAPSNCPATAAWTTSGTLGRRPRRLAAGVPTCMELRSAGWPAAALARPGGSDTYLRPATHAARMKAARPWIKADGAQAAACASAEGLSRLTIAGAS